MLKFLKQITITTNNLEISLPLYNCIIYVYKREHLFELCKYYFYFIVMDLYTNK